MDIFKENISTTNSSSIPLAERVRPKSISRFIGHKKYLGKGKFLRNLIDNNDLLSVIFWGPPGSGKTTLSRILANTADAEFHQLSAIDSGVKNLREIINIGKANITMGKRTVLFIDEIHRFNKAQQDSLLSGVETGIITLIGATTENPSFEVISPLLSRMRVIKLEALTEEDLKLVLNLAIEEDEILKSIKPIIDKKAVNLLINTCNGDARRLLNNLELSIRLAGQDSSVTPEIVSLALVTHTPGYDKKGDAHYDTISAFIKSVRGSDPDAAVYWLARMLESGEDPKFIARRLIILASEDIGNADPFGIVMANNTFSAVEKIGMPEARIILAQAATYLASAPKSNASYLAIGQAIEEVKNGPEYEVPLHLRNAPTKLMKDEGYSDGYIYPHDHPSNFKEQVYLPDEINDKIFYNPSDNGRERKISARLKELWKNKKNYNR